MGKIVSGFISTHGGFDDTDIFIDGEKITDILYNLVRENEGIGKNLYTNNNLGETKTTIYNCQMFAYFTKSKCSLEEAQESLDTYLYTGEGVCECEGEYRGYSEWTITGFDITNFKIGGHDLISEFSSHCGEYVNFVICF